MQLMLLNTIAGSQALDQVPTCKLFNYLRFVIMNTALFKDSEVLIIQLYENLLFKKALQKPSKLSLNLVGSA